MLNAKSFLVPNTLVLAASACQDKGYIIKHQVKESGRAVRDQEQHSIEVYPRLL
jgi:hypothetical protein